MGRRGEPRVAVTLPVVVRGSDARGNPFVVNTETRDISCTGARLNNLNGIVESGQKVEVQCNDQGATFRVQWVGEKGGPRMGQVGIRCLEPGKYIWGVAMKEWEADTYDPSKPAPAATLPAPAPPKPEPPAMDTHYVAAASFAGRERRQFLRHACRIAAQLTVQNGTTKLSGTIIDISLGGCYVEMFSPLPVNTFVEVFLHPGEETLHVSAQVRATQNGAGMGLSFTGMTPENFEKLRKLAPPSAETSEPPPVRQEPRRQAPAPVAAPSPPPAIAPAPVYVPAQRVDPQPYSAPGFDPIDLPATPEVFAAVVRVLFRRGLLTRAELLEELEKLKVPHI